MTTPDHPQDRFEHEDGEDAGWKCPFCGAAANDGGCSHFLAAGDNTFPNASGMGMPWDFATDRTSHHGQIVAHMTEQLAELLDRTAGRPRTTNATPRLARLVKSLIAVVKANPSWHAEGASIAENGSLLGDPAVMRAFKRYLEDLWSSLLGDIVCQHAEDQNSGYSVYFTHISTPQIQALGQALEADLKFVRDTVANVAPPRTPTPAPAAKPKCTTGAYPSKPPKRTPKARAGARRQTP